MSDYILETDSVVRNDTMVDDFIYRGGTIKVAPSATFQVSGRYLFDPTTSENALDKIYEGIKSRFSIEGGHGGIFEGFYFYNEYKQNSAIFFPCLIISSELYTKTASSFFGGKYTTFGEITIEVAFKRDKNLETSDGTLSGRSLAEYYLYNARNIITDYEYISDYVRIGEVDFEDQLHEPIQSNQTLYGFSLAASIEYLIDE